MMKRIHILLAASMLLVLAGCIKDTVETLGVVGGQDDILLVIGEGGDMLTRSVADTEVENRVTHLDVLIFDADGNKVDHELFQYPKGNVLQLKKRKSSFEVGEQYAVYLIANYPVDNEKKLSDIKVRTDLQDNLTLNTPNVHATGLDDNNDNIPKYFLMDGRTFMVLNPADQSQEAIKVPISLKRAAAKIVITLKQGDKVKFIHDEDSNEPLKNKASRKPVNFPMSTFVAEPSDGVMKDFSPVLYSGASTTIFGTEISGAGTDEMKMTMTLYAYPNDWRLDGLADNEPSVLVRVPLTENDETTVVDQNYYKIPVNLSAVEAEKGQLKRNHIYNITVTINGRGGENEAVPVELTDVKLQVVPWQSKDIVVGGEESPEFLFLSDKKVRMDNASENHSVSYSSSSPIQTVVVKEAYYYDKLGLKQNLDDSQISGLPIKVSASTDSGEGVIDISSPIPTNLAVRYIVVEVTNKDGEKEELTFEQYPLEYVTSQLGYFSYRTDFVDNDGGITTWLHHIGKAPEWGIFNGLDNTNAKGDKCAVSVKDDASLEYTSQRFSVGDNSGDFWEWVGSWFANSVFVSKVLQNYNTTEGMGVINSYGWMPKVFLISNGEFGISSIGTGRNNSNVYHVHVSSTSDAHHIGIPRMKKMEGPGLPSGTDQYQSVGTMTFDATDDAEDNKKVVSPSFMVSSQLSLLQKGDVITTKEQAAHFCHHYAEVVYRNRGDFSNNFNDESKLIVYDDWRLPTEAELKLINGYQGDINKHIDGGEYAWHGTYAMDWLLDRPQYWSASGAVDISNRNTTDYEGTIGIRCVRDHFKDK